MTYQGVLQKMQTEFTNPIAYYLVFEDSFLNVNQLLGKEIEINFQGLPMFELWSIQKNIPSRILLRLFYEKSSSRGLDYET
jgi:hypothetical protein